MAYGGAIVAKGQAAEEVDEWRGFDMDAMPGQYGIALRRSAREMVKAIFPLIGGQSLKNHLVKRDSWCHAVSGFELSLIAIVALVPEEQCRSGNDDGFQPRRDLDLADVRARDFSNRTSDEDCIAT
ncbi:hypothetical protein RISW2_17035 [Roseivivax isoporae LMG 25204]|uniref:Uncharacterized protein n=1 Tax=Roseivivax isoporae LMG 25204 TaxID=1449351 RepID=X7F2L9_9RHOB|nr:hypothetical protein RISW2_17035 [Roseivivax isoporae LMG 25204]